MQTTQAVGPSFYYADVENYKKKFTKHIDEWGRGQRHFQKTQEMSCLTRNTNIRVDDGTGGKGKGRTINKDGPKAIGSKPARFAEARYFEDEVLAKRRKSRQSTFARGVLDFDYAGDSSTYQHLIEKRGDLG